MHILFVHQNFPAQFGHVATHLARQRGVRCTFVSERAPGQSGGIERIQYRVRGGAIPRNHYCSRTFENAVWHTHAVYEALKGRPDLRPDLIVGHSGFGSTLFLRELYGDVPIVNYFEYFYQPHDSDMDFRPDFPSTELNRLRARARNAMILLDLENCDVGYSPTHWQRDRLPTAYRDKVQVVFDGVDTTIWRPMPIPDRRLNGIDLPKDAKLLTYAARGMESMRGFDVFMKVAKRLCERRDDLHVVIAGEDRVCYGGDHMVTGGASFKQWVLAADDYDLSRFHFLGLIPPADLARLFNLSDLHIYLTVPFVLSWSLMNALACGATVLASDTAPVREVIQHGKNGLLAGFFDIEGMADLADRVLNDPGGYAHLGDAGVAMIRDRFSMEVCLPRLLSLYERAMANRRDEIA
ncbi:glycosyltransferase [Tautonia marina]|uniref:glycosyltransferase n=1 Tax=Tautonia marina TaxID=2653855 RepID=UPI001260E2B7|nr:glycosyltransferase [Tautonia marina]